MTPRQSNFAAAVVACGNATQAYRACYPKSRTWKSKTVNEAASRLLRSGKVAARVAELQRQADDAAVVSRTEVLKILSRVIRASISDYLNADGTVDMDAVRGAQQELAVFVIEDAPGGRRRVRIRLADQIAAVDRMAKIQGWYRPQQIEVATTNTEEMAVLKEVFRAMSPEERAAWLVEHV